MWLHSRRGPCALMPDEQMPFPERGTRREAPPAHLGAAMDCCQLIRRGQEAHSVTLRAAHLCGYAASASFADRQGRTCTFQHGDAPQETVWERTCRPLHHICHSLMSITLSHRMDSGDASPSLLGRNMHEESPPCIAIGIFAPFPGSPAPWLRRRRSSAPETRVR